MSELSTKYNPADIEEKWYAHWEKSGYFHNEPDDREPFSIVIPPPNVTGVLHMGHMLNNTIQDALTRKARLEGKNAIWIPGTDHASIATEAKVVRMLRERGIKKSDLTRDEFMKYAWEWKEKYGGIILQQLRKLGSSCDWERTAFTMDEGYSADVIKTFVDLYNKGKLYRDYRMVNWDCEAKTVLSNEEVIHGEEQAALFHVKYFLEGSDTEGVVIATQRPETIMADAAVAVHPKDPRYAHLAGKRVIVPLVNRPIPIIFDDYVDIDFGTGALKITPAHDPNDYELGKKHGLEIIDLLNEDGTLNEKCGIASLVGVDRFDARRHMKKLLADAGNLVEIKDYKTNIGRSERTNTVVEPRMSLQWYVDMKALATPALEAVETNDIDFYPKSFKNIYRSWMAEIRDWCISRQLWWGHRIPAYYYNGETFVAETAAEALVLAQAKYPSVTAADLRQDEDVLDTWASSWLWPISTLNGFKNSEEFNYYYPTSVLVTGWDIIFLWVARMAMAGFEWKQERPFKAVYFTGMVRDKQRRKMSKSLGNSPDALLLIETFGADGVRFGMLASSPAGGDLLFDEKLCEQGRNFCNKLWNALRLIKGWEVTEGYHSETEQVAAAWFESKMNTVLGEIEENFKQFRLSEALMSLYNFIWDDFCSWYLEMIKPEYGKPIDRITLEKTEVIFRKLMAMLHPFMPFITEEIWAQLDGKNREGSDLCVGSYPKAFDVDVELLTKVEAAKDIISKIREVRNSKGLKPREPLVVKFQGSETAKTLMATEGVRNLIKKLGVLESLQTTDVDVDNSVSFVSGTDKYFVVLNQTIDIEAEREKMTKELQHQQGFLKSVNAKLSNERFVANAKPEVVAVEQKKQADALARIAILEESLAKLQIVNILKAQQMHLSEILYHLGEERENYFNAVSTPVIQSSNFAFRDLNVFRGMLKNELSGHLYSRGNNPTVQILRRKVAALESAEDALVFASGSAAVAASVIANVNQGDHVVCVNAPYSWTIVLLKRFLPRFGVTATFVDGKEAANFEKAIQPNTKVVYLESPNSLTFELQDLAACAEICKRHGVVSIIDNSHCSPIFQRPIEFGIDIVVHSATKYLNGHSDVVAGVVCGSKQMIQKIFDTEQMCLGAIIGPHDANLIIRGLRTLPLRMKKSDESAKKIVDWLKNHPKVKKIYYPYLEGTPQYDLAKKQMTGNGGLFSIETTAETIEEAEAFFYRLKRFLFAVSWGGHESLVFPTCSLYGIEGKVNPALPFNFYRFYIGLEEPEWLIEDLAQAFD